MALSKNMKTTLIVGGCAIAAYLIYKWYMNSQSSSSANNSALGTTLTGLSAGSSGPESGLFYYAAPTDIYTMYPSTTPSASGQTPANNSAGSGTGTGTTGTGTGSGGKKWGGWGANTSSGATSGSAGNTGLLTWSTPTGSFTGTVQQFLAAFQATGQNAGQIVSGGTGKKIPLKPGQSYTANTFNSWKT